MMYNTHKYNRMFLVLIVFFVSSNALNTRTVSDKQNVTKGEAKHGDFYPDWVPFKNKHGDQLGEFVQVKKKSKTIKRLAPPANFIMRAVADPEGDDYFEKDLGDGDGENYENKEWSDVNRPENAVDHYKSVNHTNISDIEGVVSIITERNLLTQALKPKSSEASRESTETQSAEAKILRDKEKKEEEEEKKEVATKETDKQNEDDYEEASSEKKKSNSEEAEREKIENEAKKAKILGSVDELKERHAEEQRALSEKLKEEEVYKEELERDKVHSDETLDKYGHPASMQKTFDTYYENEDSDTSLEEKYKIKPLRRIITTTEIPKRTKLRKIEIIKPINNKRIEIGKLSVFKNPRAYMIFDDDEDEGKRPGLTTAKPPLTRFSSKYTLPTTAITSDNVRISLVPEDSNGKDGEPTLFFPKKRKNKRRRKNKTPLATDSYVAESKSNKMAENLVTALTIPTSDTTGTTASDFTSMEDTTQLPTRNSSDLTATAATTASGADSTGTDYDATTTETDFTVSSGTDSTASAADAATSAVSAPSAVDAVAASSDHKKEAKSENYHLEKGVDREHHSENEDVHEEHGKKAYEGIHKDTKTEKGHHDKEDHLGKYDDQGGFTKKHLDEKDHYGVHEHEEHGKKHAKYEESGKHSKGHSTKGSHDIHKKEEYEKKVEFFEEEGDSAEEEKQGGHTHERGHSSGGHYKKGGLAADHQGHTKGDSGHYAKGGHENGHKGHKAAGGHDSHGKHGAAKFQAGGHQSGKKWIYHHGHPAKTANLIPIDRRTDQYQHGPQYFGKFVY